MFFSSRTSEVMNGIEENIRLLKIPKPYNIVDRRTKILVSKNEKLEEVVRALESENESLKIIVTTFTNIDTFKPKQSSPRLVNQSGRIQSIDRTNIENESYYHSKENIRFVNDKGSFINEDLSLKDDNEQYNCDSDKTKHVKCEDKQFSGHFLQDDIRINTTINSNISENKQSLQNMADKTALSDFLTGHVDDWEKLRGQVNLVIKENQILASQKLLYKRTIDDLTGEFHTRLKKNSEEISMHLQEKISIEKELISLKEDNSELRKSVEKMSKDISALKISYNNLLEEMRGKIDISIHEEKMNKLYCEQLAEFKKLVNENESLKLKLDATRSEKDNLVIHNTNLSAENLSVDIKLKSYENREKKFKDQLYKFAVGLEMACYQESLVRRTLSKAIKVAEETAIDRNMLARIICNQKETQDSYLIQLYQKNISRDKSILYVNECNDLDENNIGEVSDTQRSQKREILDKYRIELNELREMVHLKQQIIEEFQASGCYDMIT